MPSIHYMNAPNHPFWDFVQEMNDHPAWGGPHAQPQPPTQGEASRSAPGAGQDGDAHQTSDEDPPEVDPSTVRPSPDRQDMPFRARGRGHCGGERGERHGRGGRHSPEGRHGPGGHHGPGPEGRRSPDGRRGRGCGMRGGWGRFGPPPFAFGEAFSGRHGPFPGPPPPGFGHQRGGPGHPHHPFGPRGHHGPPPPPPVFNLRQFIGDLGERIGMDLQGAAEGLGLERFMTNNNAAESDFEPKADIFDHQDKYTIHVSLPGAKKEDVGVDWDGEHSVLRVAGVVHRPGVDENMLQKLVVDGRKREVGVFEKAIRLGTRRDPASIDVAGITAKMADGILIITVPKVEVEHKKRDVPISNSKTPSPKRNKNAPESTADREIEMHDAEAEPEVVEKPESLLDTEIPKEKEAEKQHEEEQERHNVRESTEETLPAYAAEGAKDESDWERFGSDDEGEFIKINVN